MNEKSHDNFIDVCKGFDNGMLVTQEPGGELVARPMMVAQIDNDGDLWFATDRKSGKVEEILAHPEVCVTMADSGRYASISGQAEVVNDRAHVQRLWSEAWRIWFPEGPDDAGLVLLRIHARSGEFWSNAGANRVKFLFEAAKAYMTGNRPQTDQTQHARVDLR